MFLTAQKYSNRNNNINSESFYAHVCSVWDEKDVLDVDIKGKGCLTNLKRFWHDLFLLSLTDMRAKHYYRSSYAMRVARAVHFRHYRHCIHPLSIFRRYWDFFILHAMLISRVFLHLNTSMIHDPGIYIHYAAAFLEVLIIFDVYLNFKTGYANKDLRKIFMDSREIAYNYLSTTLCIHVASAIPLEAIMFLRYGNNIACSSCKCNLFNVTVRIFILISTFRLFEMSSYWNRERSSFKVTALCRFFRSLVLGIIVMLQIETFSDALGMLNIIVSGQLDNKSYVYMLVMYRYNSELTNTTFLFFCLEVSRISKTFLLFGYGLQPNETTFDQMTALISYACAYLFHIWIFLACYSYMTRMCYPKDMFILNLDRTENVLRARRLPDIINLKVKEYYHCNMSLPTLTEKRNGLFVSLPDALKRDIVLSCYRRLVLQLPFFANWPVDVIDEITLLLQLELYLDKDVVANAWIQSDGLIIVEAGMLAVYSVRMEETAHLIDGDYFGELSLVTDKEMRMSTIVAVSYCSILFLDKKHFRKLMRNYPQLFFVMKKKLHESYGSYGRSVVESHQSNQTASQT